LGDETKEANGETTKPVKDPKKNDSAENDKKADKTKKKRGNPRNKIFMNPFDRTLYVLYTKKV